MTGDVDPGAIVQRPYRVSGATAADLADAIALLGPRRDGRRFAALTLWTLRWSFQPAFVGGAWRAADVRVDLDVVVHMPEWRPPRTAAAPLVAAWRSYLVALADHEGGHVAIARHAADDVGALLATATSSSASDLALAIDERARARIAAARDAEVAYDAHTGHGHAQGARWDGGQRDGAWHGASLAASSDTGASGGDRAGAGGLRRDPPGPSRAICLDQPIFAGHEP